MADEIEVQPVVNDMVVELPWLTAVIPTYGQKGVALTENCLRSLRQTHAHLDGLEIFVISDGPEGWEALQAVCQKYGAQPVLQERAGFAHACNQGLVRSNGQVTFLVNNDIEFIEPSLQIMANAVDMLSFGIVGCRLLYPDMTIQHAGVRFVPAANHPLGIPGYWDHFLRGEHALHPGAVTLAGVMVSGALLGITTWALQTVGLLDEGFGFSCEDIAYNLAVIESGRQPLYCGYTAAIHHEGATRGKTLEEKLALAPDIAEKEAASLKRLFEIYRNVDWNQFTPEGA